MLKQKTSDTNSRRKRFKPLEAGFTMIEVGIATAIMGLMVAMVLPLAGNYMRQSTLNRYAAEFEYFLKHARMVAMEKSQNVGFCYVEEANSFDLQMRLLGSAAGDPCASGVIFRTFRLPASERIRLETEQLNGYYDPRGKFRYVDDATTASACLTNRETHQMFHLHPYGLLQRREAGGDCPS